MISVSRVVARMSRTAHAGTTAGTIALMFVLSACQLSSDGALPRDWSASLRQQDISPVFPHREDLQVGDILCPLMSADAVPEVYRRLGYVPSGTWYDSLDLRQGDSSVVQEFWRARYVLPQTRYKDGQNASIEFEQHTSQSLYPANEPARARLAAFPVFTVGRIGFVDIESFAPIEALNLVMGGNRQLVDGLRVRVSSAESVGLPINRLRALLDERMKQPGWKTGVFMVMADSVKPEKSSASDKPVGRIIKRGDTACFTLVYEVYYARSIDVTVSSEASLADCIHHLNRTVLPAGYRRTTAVDRLEQPVQPDQDLLDAINRRIEALSAKTSCGSKVTLVSLGDHAAGFRIVYERPVAVGYRSVTFRLVAQSDTPQDAGITLDNGTPEAATNYYNPALEGLTR